MISDRRLSEAPTVEECLAHYGVPRHMHKDAKKAVAAWLHSWQGLDMTAEALSRRVGQ